MWYLTYLGEFGRGRPAWPVVAERLTHGSCTGPADRKDCDWMGAVRGRPRSRILANEWLGSRYTRGHLASAGAHKGSSASMQRTFTMDNMLPQEYTSNAGEWWRLELLTRDLTKWYRKVHTINGGLLLPLFLRTWSLDGHRLEGLTGRTQSSASLPSSPPPMTFEQWKAGGAWSSEGREGQKGHPEPIMDASPWVAEMAHRVADDREAIMAHLPDASIKAFKGRQDVIQTLRLGGGQLVPTHFYKLVICRGRRRSPLGEGNTKGIRPPRFMMEAFLVPNSIVPIPLPLRAYRIPLGPLERLTGMNLATIKKRFALQSRLFGTAGQHVTSDTWGDLYSTQKDFWSSMMGQWWRVAEKENRRLKMESNQTRQVAEFRKDEGHFLKEEHCEKVIPSITANYSLNYTPHMVRRLTQCWGQAFVMWSGANQACETTRSTILDIYRQSPKVDEAQPLEGALALASDRWNALDQVVIPKKVSSRLVRRRMPKRDVLSKIPCIQKLLDKFDQDQDSLETRSSVTDIPHDIPIIHGSLPPWIK